MTYQSMPEDCRQSRRRRVLKDGRILFPGSRVTYDCTIRDLSEKGARLRLQGNSVIVPIQFELVLVADGLAYPVHLKWRKGAEYGVEFMGGPRSVTARIK